MKKLILFALLLVPSIAFAQNAYYFQRKSLFEVLPLSNKDIVFLGNSITDGGEWREIFGMSNIKNRGIGGDRTQGVLDRLYQVTDANPRKVFLLIGINDLNGDPANTATAIVNIGKIIDRIKAESPKTKLYVQSVMPVNYKLVGDNAAHIELFRGKARELAIVNEAVVKMCSQKDVQYIDLHTVLADGEGLLRREYTNDGLHLMGEGYKAWADAIRKYVK